MRDVRNRSPDSGFAKELGRFLRWCWIDVKTGAPLEAGHLREFGHDLDVPVIVRQFGFLLTTAMTPCKREQLQMASGIKDREHFRKQYLLPMLRANLIEMTIPDKPRSSNQQYHTTVAGRAALESRMPKS